MARCIKESDLLTVDRDHICTDVLSDTAGFAVSHMSISDRVEQGCLAVINMSHDADDRRTSDHLILILLSFREEFTDDVFLLFLLSDDIIFHRDLRCLLKRKLMIYCDHHALHKEILHESCRLHFHSLGQLTNSQFLRDLDLGYDFLFLRSFILRLILLKSLRDT